MEGIQRLGGFVQRHGHALFVVLVGGGGVGCHFQRVQDGDDLVHGEGHAIVELLVSLAGGALAVVLVLRCHPEQLVFGLCGILLGCVELCLYGVHLACLLIEPAIFLLGVCGFCLGLLLGGCGGLGRFLRCGLGLLCFLLGSFCRLFGLFAHSRSSLYITVRRGAAICGVSFRLPLMPSPSSSAKRWSSGISFWKGIRVGPIRATVPHSPPPTR